MTTTMVVKKSPWQKPNPNKTGEHKKLSPAQKAAAKKNAKAAGRPYPNLVDNMKVAVKAKGKR